MACGTTSADGSVFYINPLQLRFLHLFTLNSSRKLPDEEGWMQLRDQRANTAEENEGFKNMHKCGCDQIVELRNYKFNCSRPLSESECAEVFFSCKCIRRLANESVKQKEIKRSEELFS